MKKLVFAVLPLLSACTYSSEALMVTAPASEVRADRKVAIPVSVYFDPQFDTLSVNAIKNGITCSAHKFPITAGPAVKQTIRRVLEESFASVDVRTQPAFNTANVVDLRVQHDTFRPSVQFASGFWSASASSQAELVARVSAVLNGKEIIAPMTIAGEGSAMGIDGGCDKGAEAANQATSGALKRLAENFVYKVVNSGELKEATAAAPTAAAAPAIN